MYVTRTLLPPKIYIISLYIDSIGGHTCDMWQWVYLEVPRAWEVLSVLVEGDGHDTVGGVEGLLHSVSMVNVNVHI